MKALLLFILIGWNPFPTAQQDSIKNVTTLQEIEVHPDDSKYHVLSNFSRQILNLNRWSIVDSSKGQCEKQLVFCTRVNSPTSLTLQKIVIKIPNIDTATHEVYCIVIQNGEVLFYAPVYNWFHSRKAVAFDVQATKINEGHFYIGIIAKQKCATCYFSQKVIPNKNGENFMMRIKDGIQSIKGDKMIPIENGIQYKIVYSL